MYFKFRKAIPLFVLSCFVMLQQQSLAQEAYHKTVVKEGIKIDFSLSHFNSDGPIGEFREGDDVLFQFKISDTITGKPLSGAFPAAWMDKVNNTTDADCGKKIVSFIEGGLLTRPELNLNIYYVLTLNDDNTINVVDPLFSFGGSQLLTQITIPSTGYDWVVNENQTDVYVSMPEANQVAFINTGDMTNDFNIDIPGQPKDLSLQKDQRYLWVTYELPGHFEASSGVAIIDTKKKVLVKTIETGSGKHEIVMSDDNNFVYVSNQGNGTVSIIDGHSLEKVGDIVLNDTPLSMAYSPKANAIYVVNKRNYDISVISNTTKQVMGKIKADEGINKIAFAPGGRLGFVLNPVTNMVHILDTSLNRIIQSADVEEQPDEVSFSDELAYVRHLGSETIWMIPLDVVGMEGGNVPLIDFTGGQNPPALGSKLVGAPGIVQAPGANAVLVSNFKDESIYYYTEGMAAPNGHFSTYGKKPKAVEVVDKSIEETSIGVYETVVQLRFSGEYEVSLYVDVPSFMECFPVTVLPNKEKQLQELEDHLGPLSISFLPSNSEKKVGEEVTIKFSLSDVRSQELASNLTDVKLMSMNSAGRGHRPQKVKETDVKGVYETNLTFNEEGLYYVYIECLSRGLTYNNQQFLTLYASAE